MAVAWRNVGGDHLFGDRLADGLRKAGVPDGAGADVQLVSATPIERVHRLMLLAKEENICVRGTKAFEAIGQDPVDLVDESLHGRSVSL